MRKLVALTVLALLYCHSVRAETPQSFASAPTSKYDCEPASVLATMDSELQRSISRLKNAGKAPVYYLAYRLYEGNWDSISASNGALLDISHGGNWRMLSVDLRVGNCHFDNTHFLRGENSASPTFWERSSKRDSILPDGGAGLPLQQCLWITTDEAYKSAQQRYSELTVSHEVMSAEDDKSDDFSFQPVHNYQSTLKKLTLDRPEWTARVRRLSQLFLKHPNFTSSKVSLTAEPTTRYMVNSEGSKIVEQHSSYCISVEASALAKDGMQLSLTDSVNALDPALLPDEVVLAKKVEKLAESLEQLCRAPVAEAYVGPAILSGRAAAVFFHETFGHRVEALHQKNENEGKTFSHKIGSTVMPSFLTVIDDPTAAKVGSEYLNGHYFYDDEGVAAQPVTIAKRGVLTSFLLSRTLVRGFKASNGHGRCSPGWNPVARQANLFVQADKTKQVSPHVLRSMLIKEAVRQHKSYGLLFDEIAGGSTCTSSDSDQTYNVHPLKVYKVFVDGRPDQLIRGAEIVGTPLAALERVIAAGNDIRVFNGTCGRDSGFIPVSAVAPSLLIQSIETKRTLRSTEKTPILSDPTIKKSEPLATSESDRKR
ncbi:MAG: metallopeptidase TldD-related protein [Candidatus Obscuribacterales bacterium]